MFPHASSFSLPIVPVELSTACNSILVIAMQRPITVRTFSTVAQYTYTGYSNGIVMANRHCYKLVRLYSKWKFLSLLNKEKCLLQQAATIGRKLNKLPPNLRQFTLYMQSLIITLMSPRKVICTSNYVTLLKKFKVQSPSRNKKILQCIMDIILVLETLLPNEINTSKQSKQIALFSQVATFQVCTKESHLKLLL